ncbi:hypothetical protein CsatB_009622 [Cannabis sativa]
MYFSPNTPENLRTQYEDTLHMQTIEAITQYLGLPMISGRNKQRMFIYIKEKVWSRLNSWNSKLFSYGGREILLKTVIQAMPMYAMSCFQLPVILCDQLEALMARYWWSSSVAKQKTHWLACRKMCLPKSQGGLGFRTFEHHNQALLAAQAWRILTCPDSLPARIFRAKYFSHTTFLTASGRIEGCL